MADVLKGSLAASASWTLTETLDQSSVVDGGSVSFTWSISDGTTASKADAIWHDERTITTGANDDLDLTALTRTIYNSTVTTTFVKVKAILISNLSTTAGDSLVVRTNATNGFTKWANGINTSRGEIGPSSPWLVAEIITGWTVSGTDKVLRINNPGANSINYEIIIIGTTA